jgi:DNA invertase Pin-like site-specific DNA recombinase
MNFKKHRIIENNIYSDYYSGANDKRPGVDSCLKALGTGHILVVWKLDRLGRNWKHLVNSVHNLNDRGVEFKVLAGSGADINTTTPAGKLLCGIFASLSECERKLICERTKAGLESARARGKKGGRKFSLSKAQVRLAEAAMGKKETIDLKLC